MISLKVQTWHILQPTLRTKSLMLVGSIVACTVVQKYSAAAAFSSTIDVVLLHHWGHDIIGTLVFLFPPLPSHYQILLVNITRLRITPKHRSVKYHRGIPYFTTPITGWWRQTEIERTSAQKCEGVCIRVKSNTQSLHTEAQSDTLWLSEEIEME